MRQIGVLTGDVVGSQKIKDKQALGQALNDGLNLLEARLGACSDRYRGDGFQIAVPDPAQAMTAAVLLRATLIQHSPSRQAMWDARIAVATGEGDMPSPQSFTDAQGEVFVRSGRQLDVLSATTDRLSIVTDNRTLDNQWALLTRFADDIITHWSRYSAEVVALSLQHAESQQALARRLGRAQPTVNRRLAAARWPLIRDYLAHIRAVLTERLG